MAVFYTHHMLSVNNNIIFQSERILSFIPPDGNFRLMSYHIGSQSVVAIPIYVRHNLTLRSNGDQGRLDLTVGPKQTMGRTLESKLCKFNSFNQPYYLLSSREIFMYRVFKI